MRRTVWAESLRDTVARELVGTLGSDVQRIVSGAFFRNGLLREAAAATEQAVRLNPGHDDLRVELGDLYSRMGLPERAGEQYRQVLARQPTHEAASRGLRAVGGLQNPG